MTARSSESTPLGRQREPTVSSLIFLGTGTSSQVPAIGCLTNPTSKCQVCPSALHPATQKNRRRNTSALIELSNRKTILIDCGKSFFEAALQLWPRARLRQIDAVLLTHAHADAMLGLDDLRGWTLGRFVQDTIHIYVSESTYGAIKAMFPYMVDSNAATGGGDIPAFDWHIISEDEAFNIESCGVTVETLKVEHGKYFNAARDPFWCLGFRIGDVSYISDVSAFPEETLAKIEGGSILIIDALKVTPHASHISIPQALDVINGLAKSPRRTYLLDFTHDVDHYALEEQLRREQRLDIRPAYDGLQLLFGRLEDSSMESVNEVDLLATVPWIALSEVDKREKKDSVKSMV